MNRRSIFLSIILVIAFLTTVSVGALASEVHPMCVHRYQIIETAEYTAIGHYLYHTSDPRPSSSPFFNSSSVESGEYQMHEVTKSWDTSTGVSSSCPWFPLSGGTTVSHSETFKNSVPPQTYPQLYEQSVREVDEFCCSHYKRRICQYCGYEDIGYAHIFEEHAPMHWSDNILCWFEEWQ